MIRDSTIASVDASVRLTATYKKSDSLPQFIVALGDVFAGRALQFFSNRTMGACPKFCEVG